MKVELRLIDGTSIVLVGPWAEYRVTDTDYSCWTTESETSKENIEIAAAPRAVVSFVTVTH